MFDLSGLESLHEYQEQARCIADLNDRLQWLEDMLRRQEMAKESHEKNEGLKALFNSGNVAKRLAGFREEKTVFDILPIEINRTKDLLLLEEIKTNAESKPSLRDALFYLIECKTDYFLLGRLTFFKDTQYVKEINGYIKELQSRKENPMLTNIKPIKWTGSQIELVTMFYDLLACELIDAKKTEIAKFLAASFVDKDGQSISYEYIYKILKPDTEKSSNRADFSSLC